MVRVKRLSRAEQLALFPPKETKPRKPRQAPKEETPSECPVLKNGHAPTRVRTKYHWDKDWWCSACGKRPLPAPNLKDWEKDPYEAEAPSATQPVQKGRKSGKSA